MSYLAQYGFPLRLFGRAAPLSLFLAMGCTDLDPAKPDALTTTQAADSSITSFNALVRHAPNAESDALSGGEATVFDSTSEAFNHAAPNLTASELATHDIGDDAFMQVFSPATGLGPQLNNPSCEGCHLLDGRGALPAQGSPLASMLLRISIPGVASDGGPLPVPQFGAQLQPIGVAPVPREADVSVTYVFSDGRYGNGERFELRRPLFQILNPHAPLPASLLVSPRVAPPNFGLGLLEAVPRREIAALADESDRDGDGISGRMNIVFDAIDGRPALGRFGAKANNPSQRQQTAGAFNGDMGITTSVFPAESCEGVFAACARHQPDISDDMLKAVTFYVQTLAVPARRCSRL